MPQQSIRWAGEARREQGQAYADETLSRAHVSEWHKWFTGGRDNVEDDERAGHPRSSNNIQNIAKIPEMSEFPLTSLVRLLINASTLKY
ncbi:hypothetical protein TNCV_1643321 [Trichonephila clavipes]|nr:hypothetical protein TNCV_1643321 [Trichonephila clavipes]